MIDSSLQQDGKSPNSDIVLKRYNIGLHNVSNVHLINSFYISTMNVDFRDFKSFTDFFNPTASKFLSISLFGTVDPSSVGSDALTYPLNWVFL